MAGQWRLKYPYSTTEKEKLRFVDENPSVKVFLGRYEYLSACWWQRARALNMFFSWLHKKKGLDLNPSQFLKALAEKRVGLNDEDRNWGKDLLLGFTRLNPDFKGKSHSYLYGMLFTTVKMFCDSREIPLTSEKAAYGGKFTRKYHEPPLTVDLLKKTLSLLNQRDRAVSMVMVQSGQSICQVLNDVSSQTDYVIKEIESGAERIKFCFSERKGNGFNYWTYISTDAIQELRKWLVVRAEWLNGKQSEWLFITENCERLTEHQFHQNFRAIMKRHGLWTGPFSIRPHSFRKFFESEASPPDRGISKDYAVFMMGHANGVMGNRLDSVGGIYDTKARADESIVEREYQKLEPYLNIYSNNVGQNLAVSPEEKEAINKIERFFGDNPEKLEKLLTFIKAL